MLDLTKPVQQENGEAVEIICTTADLWLDGVHFPVIGIASKEVLRSYRADGGFNASGTSNFDLVNVPAKHQVRGWLNVYRNERVGKLHVSKEVADRQAGKRRIACVEINLEVTEGQGLDGAFAGGEG